MKKSIATRVRRAEDIPGWLEIPTPIVIVDTPASLQELVLEQLLPSLTSSHTVVFNSGKLASLVYAGLVEASGCRLAETNVDLFATTHRPVYLAGRPESLTESLVESMRPDFPQLLPAASPQECALNDPLGVLGPVTLLLNLSRIEQMGPYRSSRFDATESVARVVDALDQERKTLASAHGQRAHSLAELLGGTGGGAYQVLKRSGLWDRHMSPDSVSHAHFCEEIPYSLAAWVELARVLEVAVPHMQSVMTLAEAALGRELSARRSFLAAGGRPAEPAPEDDHLLSLGLAETVQSGPRGLRLTLSGLAVEAEPPEPPRPLEPLSPSLSLPTAEIAESFEKLRKALEEKLGE